MNNCYIRKIFPTALVLAVLAVLAASLASRVAQAAPNTAPNAGEQVTVAVHGLVCDFCARSIEKVLKRRDEVSTVRVNLGAGRIDLNMRAGQSLADDTIVRLMQSAGYTVVGIERAEQVP